MFDVFFNSKKFSDGKIYDLTSPIGRYKYFHAKASTQIERLKYEIESGRPFLGFLLAKKVSGKGTYSKMFEEIFGLENFCHLSVGDLVRALNVRLLSDGFNSPEVQELKRYYRGYVSFTQALEAVIARDRVSVGVPSELILAMLQNEIEKNNKKAMFVDGLPRTQDQLSYSLFFRQLVRYPDNNDFFCSISVPESLIELRMSSRLVCPLCSTTKNYVINPSTIIRYDESSKEFIFICDNKNCVGYQTQVLTKKEGDAEGLDVIRGRLDQDMQLMQVAESLHGVNLIKVLTAFPKNIADHMLDEYEIQKRFEYELVDGNVVLKTEPLEVVDDSGTPCFTPYAATGVLFMLHAIHQLLTSNGEI